MTQAPHDELYDRARQAIRELKEKLAAAEARGRTEPVAVIGMGIRFPGAGNDLGRLWDLIRNGEDATIEIPADRWDRDAFYAPEPATPGRMNTRRAAFVQDVSHFDASFFDITPVEAARMDPQQRIFLETAWHAIEDAGLTRKQLSGSDTGVFVGVHTHSADYQAMQFSGSSLPDAYAGSGTAHDMIGGRLAYWLDLHGPSLTVNTACSSSLMAIHLASRSIRASECDMAIVGGVNLLLKPISTVAAAQLQLLAPDGRCKTFDARADGMGRGEGCGVVVLKRLGAAQRDGDRILAVLRGSAVNQDGRTNGLTSPNGLAQQRVIRRALQDADVAAEEIGYVEAHGTGTALGDPIEVEALAEVFGSRLKKDALCSVGAIKANIGHLEGAAGIAGLIKTVLVLKHGWVPPVAGLKELNPHLRPYVSTVDLPRQGKQWVSAVPRLAGVSSFGWSGTNVHVVLEEHVIREETVQPRSGTLDAILPLLLTASSEKTLERLVATSLLQLERIESGRLGNLCFTSAMRRTHHTHRVAVCGRSREELASALRVRGAADYGGSSSQLTGTMRRWERGEEVDWQPFFAVPYGVEPGPLYPFEPVRHWIEAEAEPASSMAPADWIYETAWVSAPLADAVLEHPRRGRYLLIDNGEEGGDLLARGARQVGYSVLVVRRGSRYALDGFASATVTNFSTDLGRLLGELDRAWNEPMHVMYLVRPGEAADEISRLLELAQSLCRQAVPIKFSFIALRFDGADRGSPEAAVRGFSRTFALEHPETAGPFVQVDGLGRETIDALFAELARREVEARVRLCEGDRYVARLRRETGSGNPTPIRLKPDKSYLITGAFGRLGLDVARWMIYCGARHLVLVGRRDPTSTLRVAEIAALREAGTDVVVRACDLSDEAAVSCLLQEVAAFGRPLGGIVHAAADSRFGAIAEAKIEDVLPVFWAKVEGARTLDHLTRGNGLDFFVVFGSAAATIGMREAAIYAAANSCLDEIVENRKAAGQHALCVEWGFWDRFREVEDGAGDPQRQRQLLHDSGFLPMPPQLALQALGRLIASGRTSALVAAIDWTILAPLLQARAGAAMIEGLAGAPEGEQAATKEESLAALRSLNAAELDARLIQIVSNEVRGVFGMGPHDALDEERGLFQLGMNSLMSVQLKRRLEQSTGLRLPGTLIFLYPSARALTGYLRERIAPPAVDERLTESEDEGETAVLQMSETDVVEAIAVEIAAVHERLGRR